MFFQNGGKSEHSGLEQSSVIKFLVAEKCIPCGIYRRMSDVYRESYFSQKDVYKWTNNGFATTSLSQRDSP